MLDAKMAQTPDDIVANALAGVSSVYFTARYHKEKMCSARPWSISLSGACDSEVQAASTDRDRRTPTSDMRAEVMRLYLEGLVIPVTRRSENDGIMTIEYLAMPSTTRTKKVFRGCYAQNPFMKARPSRWR